MFEAPAREMERGDSATEATKRVEVKGVNKAERVTGASSIKAAPGTANT